MKNITIEKKTEFMKWLKDCYVHCKSKDVVVGEIYNGYTTNDNLLTDCRENEIRTVYYSEEEGTLLAEDTETKRFVFLRGRMYVYDGALYCESICFYNFSRGLTLEEFVWKAVEKLRSEGKEPDEESLTKMFLSFAPQKIAGYFKNSFKIIAEAYLNGYIKAEKEKN